MLKLAYRIGRPPWCNGCPECRRSVVRFPVAARPTFVRLSDDKKIHETRTEGKIMPADFYRDTPRAFGHTIPHFQKSQNQYSEQRSLQQFLRISFSFSFLFLPQLMEGRTFLRKTNHVHDSPGYASDARRCDVSYSTQD